MADLWDGVPADLTRKPPRLMLCYFLGWYNYHPDRSSSVSWTPHWVEFGKTPDGKPLARPRLEGETTAHE